MKLSEILSKPIRLKSKGNLILKGFSKYVADKEVGNNLVTIIPQNVLLGSKGTLLKDGLAFEPENKNKLLGFYINNILYPLSKLQNHSGYIMIVITSVITETYSYSLQEGFCYKSIGSSSGGTFNKDYYLTGLLYIKD